MVSLRAVTSICANGIICVRSFHDCAFSSTHLRDQRTMIMGVRSAGAGVAVAVLPVLVMLVAMSVIVVVAVLLGVAVLVIMVVVVPAGAGNWLLQQVRVHLHASSMCLGTATTPTSAAKDLPCMSCMQCVCAIQLRPQ